MLKLTLLAALAGLASTTAFGIDRDLSYGPRVDYTPGARQAPATKAVTYYKPTMRYFGKGYTVTYRYVQSDVKAKRTGISDFVGPQYYLPATVVQTVVGLSPRVIHSNQAPAAPVTGDAARK